MSGVIDTMNARERMHRSIEQMIDDIIKMQDIAIQLSRETYELHVAKEHEAKHHLMKEQISQLQTRLERVQEFLVTVDPRSVSREHSRTEIDIAS